VPCRCAILKKTNAQFFAWKRAASSTNLKDAQANGIIMQASVEIRKKLATLIGHLISRCLDEARMIPTVLRREEVINLLVDDPALFEKLVHDEHADHSELSREDLTVKMDAVAELGKMDALKAFDEQFWNGNEIELTPILDLTNQLTRTFAVYVGNAATLFDREFEEFMNKFRQSMQRAGMTIQAVDFDADDIAIFENTAVAYLDGSEFLQAFTFDRLLSSQIMMKQVVNLPPAGFALRENLIRRALKDPKLFSGAIKFVLRVSYISQGSWDDMVPLLLRLIRREPGLCSIAQLADYIEQDIVFSCNLLCNSYAEIRQWPAEKRRQTIESSLERYAI
jgi:hypothetical protein